MPKKVDKFTIQKSVEKGEEAKTTDDNDVEMQSDKS